MFLLTHYISMNFLRIRNN